MSEDSDKAVKEVNEASTRKSHEVLNPKKQNYGLFKVIWSQLILKHESASPPELKPSNKIVKQLTIISDASKESILKQLPTYKNAVKNLIPTLSGQIGNYFVSLWIEQKPAMAAVLAGIITIATQKVFDLSSTQLLIALSVIAPFLSWGVFATIGLIISVTFHEFAHAFVASRIKGVIVDKNRVSLNPLAHLFEGNKLAKTLHVYADDSVSKLSMAVYTAAGPVFNILLGLLGLTLSNFSGLTGYQVFAWINFSLAAMNLLPIVLNNKEQTHLDGAYLWEFMGLKPLFLKHSFSSSTIFALAGGCRAMRIAEANSRIARGLEGNEKRSQEEVQKRRKEAGIKLVKSLKPFTVELVKETEQNSQVKTNVDERRIEQAASHAIQDAVDNAVKNKDFSEETFKATVEERMAAQLRSAENGGMTEDDETTVREVLNKLKIEGVTLGDIANAWQKEFSLLANLSELPDAEKEKLAQEIGHGSHHHESLPDQHLEGHHHTHTYLFTPIDGIILRLLKQGFFFITRFFALSVTTTTTEDVYAWLKSKVPELTDEDMKLLKEMTDDKALQTDRPLTEQPDVLSNIVTALNVPYGQKNNVILVGKEGVGKSTQLRLIDQKLKAGQFKGPITERRFLTLTTTLSPSSSNDAKKFEALMQILVRTKGRIMLFRDEFHSLTRGVHDTADFAFADIMKPYLEDGKVTIIGATTFSEQRQFISRNSAYQRRFHIIQVPEPNDSQTENILSDYKPYFEKEFGLEIAEDVIPAVVQLTGDFLPEESFPAKAVDTLKYACSTAYNTYNNLALEMSSTMQTLRGSINKYIYMAKRGKEDSDEGVVLYNKILALANYLRQMELQRTTLESNRVTQGIVRTYLTKKTDIDIQNVTEGKAQKYLDMESSLQERVAGQTEAVVAISKAIRRAKSGLKDPNRPISSFMFVGPTGVGKTELAKAVAKFEFGDDEAAMIRIDMSEYMESHSVARLIGAPPGYVGHDEGGQLTEKALRRPYSLILFDEIEKAHPDVWNILLQVLDDGRLTDGKGQTVNFKNTIIVLSSNIGMNRVQDELGALSEKLKTANSSEEMQEIINHMNHAVAQGVKDGFEEAVRIGRIKPEFLNRLDGQIVFNVLTPPVMEQITRIQLNRDLTDLLMRQGYGLQSTPEVYKFLAQKGLDPVYGARPLKRVIDKNVKDPLADFILEAHAKRQGLNGGVVHLFINEGKVEFRIEGKPKGTVNRSEPSSTVQPLMVLIEEIIDSPETQMSEIDIAKKLEVDTGKQGTSSEELGPVKLNIPLEFTAQGERVSHNVNPNRKNDKGVDEAQEAIITLLRSKNPPEKAEKAIAIFNKWFKEFVKIAKQRTDNTSVVIRWAMDESGILHVTIDQRNRILPDIVKELRPSLEPDVTTEDEILEAEYTLAEEGKPVNRTLMELKRDIADISGSSFGLAGSQYWLQLAPLPDTQPNHTEAEQISDSRKSTEEETYLLSAIIKQFGEIKTGYPAIDRVLFGISKAEIGHSLFTFHMETNLTKLAKGINSLESINPEQFRELSTVLTQLKGLELIKSSAKEKINEILTLTNEKQQQPAPIRQQKPVTVLTTPDIINVIKDTIDFMETHTWITETAEPLFVKVQVTQKQDSTHYQLIFRNSMRDDKAGLKSHTSEEFQDNSFAGAIQLLESLKEWDWPPLAPEEKELIEQKIADLRQRIDRNKEAPNLREQIEQINTSLPLPQSAMDELMQETIEFVNKTGWLGYGGYGHFAKVEEDKIAIYVNHGFGSSVNLPPHFKTERNMDTLDQTNPAKFLEDVKNWFELVDDFDNNWDAGKRYRAKIVELKYRFAQIQKLQSSAPYINLDYIRDMLQEAIDLIDEIGSIFHEARHGPQSTHKYETEVNGNDVIIRLVPDSQYYRGSLELNSLNQTNPIEILTDVQDWLIVKAPACEKEIKNLFKQRIAQLQQQIEQSQSKPTMEELTNFLSIPLTANIVFTSRPANDPIFFDWQVGRYSAHLNKIDISNTLSDPIEVLRAIIKYASQDKWFLGNAATYSLEPLLVKLAEWKTATGEDIVTIVLPENAVQHRKRWKLPLEDETLDKKGNWRIISESEWQAEQEKKGQTETLLANLFRFSGRLSFLNVLNWPVRLVFAPGIIWHEQAHIKDAIARGLTQTHKEKRHVVIATPQVGMRGKQSQASRMPEIASVMPRNDSGRESLSKNQIESKQVRWYHYLTGTPADLRGPPVLLAQSANFSAAWKWAIPALLILILNLNLNLNLLSYASLLPLWVSATNLATGQGEYLVKIPLFARIYNNADLLRAIQKDALETSGSNNLVGAIPLIRTVTTGWLVSLLIRARERLYSVSSGSSATSNIIKALSGILSSKSVLDNRYLLNSNEISIFFLASLLSFFIFQSLQKTTSVNLPIIFQIGLSVLQGLSIILYRYWGLFNQTIWPHPVSMHKTMRRVITYNRRPRSHSWMPHFQLDNESQNSLFRTPMVMSHPTVNSHVVNESSDFDIFHNFSLHSMYKTVKRWLWAGELSNLTRIIAASITGLFRVTKRGAWPTITDVMGPEHRLVPKEKELIQEKMLICNNESLKCKIRKVPYLGLIS